VAPGAEFTCDDPVDEFAVFEEDAAARGVVQDPLLPGDVGMPEAFVRSALAATDIDADGDVDLVFARLDAGADLYLNNGAARFEHRRLDGPERSMLSIGLAVVDLDDDGLPELILPAPDYVAMRPNLGGGAFAEPTVIHVDAPGERAIHTTVALGDVDGDGDLDMALPSMGLSSDPGGEVASPDVLLLNEGPDGWRSLGPLPRDEPGLAFVGLITDRDLDGDRDVLIASEGGRYGYPPSAFYRNDGLDGEGAPVLRDDAPEISADTRMSAMGVDVVDLDGDGGLDYCFTDTGPVICLLSDDAGYVEASPDLGLAPDAADVAILWSLEIVDLDNDGALDAVASGGPPNFDGDFELTEDGRRDVLWQGTGDRFEDRSAEAGFDDSTEHYALAVADLDGDGSLDIVTGGGPTGPPRLWMNRCRAGGAVIVDLLGPPGNHEGWGAIVSATWDGGSLLRELQPVRAFGQGPSEVHVGTGASATVDVTVRWPDGAVQSGTGVVPGRRLVFTHPEHLGAAE